MISPAGIVLGLIAVFVATSITLFRYGDIKKQHIPITVAILIAWYFSFSIVFIIPLDVSSTSYRQCIVDCNGINATYTVNKSNSTQSAQLKGNEDQCGCTEPWTYLSEEFLLIFWKVIYWTTQILTWLVLPLMQSYTNAGDFSVLGKIKSAIIANVIYYGTYLILFCIFLIYLATDKNIHLNAEYLKVIGITASNTWGLFLLILLYGYGLVDIPRSLWLSSNTNYMLQQTYFKIAKISLECSETNEKYEDTLEEIRRAAESIKYNHAYRQYIDTILTKCPEDFKKSIRRNDDFVDYNSDNLQIPNEKQLVKMHLNIISVTRSHTRVQHQKSTLIETAIQLEDDLANQLSGNRCYKSSGPKYNGFFKLFYSPRIVWLWRCTLRAITQRFFAVLLVILSAMVVWSECVFFVTSPTLSLFALFIRIGSSHFSYISIEIVCMLLMSYLCVCAYRTVFKIRIFNYYYLANDHHSDEYSLIFSAMLLSRLTPPLCLNFLSLVHLDGHIIRNTHIQETAYTKIMGHMDVIWFIDKGFNVYFPIAIVVLCLATIFRLGTRFLNCIGFEQFIDNNISQEIVDEGMNLVKREKLLRERETSRSERAADWKRTLENSKIVHSSSLNKITQRPRKEDKVEIMDDAEEMAYDQYQNNDPYSTTTKASSKANRSNIFHDV